MSGRIYVGNLPIDIKEQEIDDLFYKYGKIDEIDLKCPARPPAFAFVTFRYVRDAEDAVRSRDNYNFDGYRLRCEFAKADRRDRDRDDRGRGRGGPGKRTDYSVIVTNLPDRTSWQDLKDHMRKAVKEVAFADVDRDGNGVVDFLTRDDMEYAIKKLDDTELRTHHNATGHIRMKAGKNSGGRDRSEDRRGSRKDKRSVSRSRSRSRSHSPARRSRSRSPVRRSRSRSRSYSRSRSHSMDDADRKRKSSEDDIKPLSASSVDAVAPVAVENDESK